MEHSFGIDDSQSNTGDQRTKKYIMWGCLGVLAIAVCVCVIPMAGGAGLLAKYGGEPEGLSADYSMPNLVKEGETFELVITMTNTGSSDIPVSDIDLDEMLDDSILDGAIVLSTDPDMKKDYSISGIKTFNYNHSIHPGKTNTVTFTIQAVTPGEYGGSIGIYVGDLAKRFDYVDLVITEQ